MSDVSDDATVQTVTVLSVISAQHGALLCSAWPGLRRCVWRESRGRKGREKTKTFRRWMSDYSTSADTCRNATLLAGCKTHAHPSDHFILVENHFVLSPDSLSISQSYFRNKPEEQADLDLSFKRFKLAPGGIKVSSSDHRRPCDVQAGSRETRRDILKK